MPSVFSFNHLNSPGVVVSPGIGAQADPCSRETVLSVLRESRKREVDEEERCASGQKSKRRYVRYRTRDAFQVIFRKNCYSFTFMYFCNLHLSVVFIRRNDSGGSSQSAFEPLLANGAPSQLVPK